MNTQEKIEACIELLSNIRDAMIIRFEDEQKESDLLLWLVGQLQESKLILENVDSI